MGVGSSLEFEICLKVCVRGSTIGCAEAIGVTAFLPEAGRAAGSGLEGPALMGVEMVLLSEGSPTVCHKGNSSSNPMTTACSPNEVNVVQLRRVRWAHEVSSMLSANMMSSCLKSVCCNGHHGCAARRLSRKEKRP